MELITASLSLTREQWLALMVNAHADLSQWQEDLREAEENHWRSEADLCRTEITRADALLASLREVMLPHSGGGGRGAKLGDVYRDWAYDQLRITRDSMKHARPHS